MQIAQLIGKEATSDGTDEVLTTTKGANNNICGDTIPTRSYLKVRDWYRYIASSAADIIMALLFGS